MRVLLLALLLLPQMAAAGVYMCKDPTTGKTTFSDKGCATAAVTEEIRIQSNNVDSGRRTADPVARKAWISDRDTRKTGRDYFAEKRELLANRATASASGPAASDDS
ncbi:MAG: DUF4124 domain-containing protein [Halieaceae bacterium]|jgi:hypothetical protein|nr:DUF4124 domain-containing protein [Halieaceae bacterium]